MLFFSPKKKKKEEEKKQKMAEVPTFKLVLVGDGGTGTRFSFFNDESDVVYLLFLSLSACVSFFECARFALLKSRESFFFKGDDRPQNFA